MKKIEKEKQFLIEEVKRYRKEYPKNIPYPRMLLRFFNVNLHEYNRDNRAYINVVNEKTITVDKLASMEEQTYYAAILLAPLLLTDKEKEGPVFDLKDINEDKEYKELYLNFSRDLLLGEHNLEMERGIVNVR